MSIQNAKTFIESVQTDKDFRKQLYAVKGFDQFNNFLDEKELTFNEGEFEEAYSTLMFKCQFAEEHDALENTLNLIKLCLVE